jgi:Cytochrome P450
MFPLASSLSLFSLVLVLLWIIRKTTYKNKSYKLPPSPPKLPFIGNLHQAPSLTLHSLRALSLKYGPLMFLHLGQVRMLVVSSADMAKEIMKKHDDIFASRPTMKADNILGYDAKNVSFTPYGDYWRSAKKLYVAHLLGNGIVSLYLSINC